MKEKRYEIGDVVLIGDEIIIIDSYNDECQYCNMGHYEISILKHNGKSDICCTELFDGLGESKVLGNINIDNGWKVLYSKQNPKQRT